MSEGEEPYLPRHVLVSVKEHRVVIAWALFALIGGTD